MRFPCSAFSIALLGLVAACGRGNGSAAQWNTTLDATTHDKFFPIAPSSRHALGTDSPAISCDSCHGSADSFKQFDCLSCHQHADPAALGVGHRGIAGYAYQSTSCYSCHARGTAVPAIVTLTGWSSGTSITSSTVTFSHPSISTYTSCGQCHAGSDYSTIIDYNHDGLTSNVTINGVAATPNLGASKYDASANPTFCVHCHNSGSPWILRSGLSSTIAANTASGSTSVSAADTSALTAGMIVSGTGIPATTTTTSNITGANIINGSTTVTTSTPVDLSAGTVIAGTGIPANDTVAQSVRNATSFTLTAAATASASSVTLTATRAVPLTVTIQAISSPTSFTVSTAADATTTATMLSVTHKSARQASIGSHGGSTNGQDCTSCHAGGGNQHLTPPTPGVFGSGDIGGG